MEIVKCYDDGMLEYTDGTNTLQFMEGGLVFLNGNIFGELQTGKDMLYFKPRMGGSYRKLGEREDATLDWFAEETLADWAE